MIFYTKFVFLNPVGRENMRAIIRRNGWKEVM